MENFKNMPIEELNISVRTYNCLKRHGVSTVGDLSAMAKEELTRVRNLGKRNYDEILEKLDNIGISLASEDAKGLP